MSSEECKDSLRYSLSDESGVLRFDGFEIVSSAECRETQKALQEYLVGRALSEVDLDYLRGLACSRGGGCMDAVIEAVQEHQEMFAHVGNGEWTTRRVQSVRALERTARS